MIPTNLSAELSEHARRMEQLSALALTELKSAKVDDAKVVASFSQTQKVIIENKEFTLAQTIGSENLSIAAYKNRKKGSSSINATEDTAIKKAVNDAVSLTEFGVEDEYLCVARLEKAPPAKMLEFLFDDQVANLKMETLAEVAGLSLDILGRDARLAIDRCEFTSNISYSSFHNTQGVMQQEIQTQVGWTFFGMARDGEEVTGFDYDGGASFRWDGVQKSVTDLAENFAEKLLKGLKPVACTSYRGAVLFSPRAVEEILLPFIFFHASGNSIMDGKSRWGKDLGGVVANRALTITDNPYAPYLAGASAFDRDGIPTREQKIIENGVLKSFLFDCYSAKKLGKESNAFAGGPFGIHMSPGKDQLSSILNAQPNLLVVDRFSGNSDPIKGDMSGVAKSSRLFVQGRDAGAVTETMIAGNLFEMLMAISMVSQETTVVSSEGVFPYVLIDGVSVTGNS